MDKADFLQECMSEFKNAPIDAFNREFCMMCSNRECSRSWGNASIFDVRVKNWRSVLFENVPRIDDPKMANHKFEPVDKVPEVVSTQSFETSVPLSYEDVPDTDPSVTSFPAPTAPQTPEPKSEARASEVMNTPFEQPMILGGGPVKKEEKTEPPGTVFVFDDE